MHDDVAHAKSDPEKTSFLLLDSRGVQKCSVLQASKTAETFQEAITFWKFQGHRFPFFGTNATDENSPDLGCT